MARFIREGDTLHVHPDGQESNIGVYDGVETVHFHDGVKLKDVLVPWIESRNIVLDGVISSIFEHYDWTVFPYVEKISFDLEGASVYLIANLLMGSLQPKGVEPILVRDTEVTLRNDRWGQSKTFLFPKGTKRDVFIEALFAVADHIGDSPEKFATSTLAEVKEERRHCRTLSHPMLWVELYFALVDIAGVDCAEGCEFIRKYAGREVKKYFFELKDALVIRLINEDLLTKATMKALLDMANDDGRVDVAAAILNKTTPKRSRFAI